MIKRNCVTGICLAVIGSAMIGFAGAADREIVPAEFRGRWVPGKASCDSPVAVVIGGDTLTLVNARDRETLGGIEMAGPGYFPPDYHGIEAVLFTEFDGQQPLTATFNPGEKKGLAQVNFARIQPGKPTSLLRAYNGRIATLNLGKRFPLDAVPLKKCTGKVA